MNQMLRSSLVSSDVTRSWGLLVLTVLALAAPAWAAPLTNRWVIVGPANPSSLETLAAREVRRYLYLRTGQLFPIVTKTESSADLILIAKKDQPLLRDGLREEDRAALDALGPQQYWIRGSRTGDHMSVVLAGGDDVGILYAAYRLAEQLGVRFYLDGDVIPDEPLMLKASDGIGSALSALEETGRPIFSLRGIQPFHDFPEGPDWWNRDDYLRIISQLPKLRLNFFGLHTYPEKAPNAEPTVWIGLKDDIGTNGQVHFAYPASYQNTTRGNWGYAAKKTSEYHFGASQLFESDDYGGQVMSGNLPQPSSAEGSQQVFERTATLLRDAFEQARRLGVQTCVGTETPLTVPEALARRLRANGQNPTNSAVIEQLYEGVFQRAAQAYPIDYYWLWTPETWNGKRQLDSAIIQSALDDLAIAVRAHKAVDAPFKLAACGWALGPPHHRALLDAVLPKDVALSCLNGTVGESRVDSAFATIADRAKWAIPWLEDDKALTIPQLWVGRMRRDAFDARRYGCSGLMGIHWRTRAVGPTLSALAQAAWDQRPWSSQSVGPLRLPGPAGGWPVSIYPPPPIADANDPTVYQSMREDVSAYYVPASNGLYKITLNFCEPLYHEAGRRVFTVKLQGKPVVEQLDISARVGKNRALDFAFDHVQVTNGWIDIEFVPQVEFPIISGITVSGKGFSHQINCGGPAHQRYVADDGKPPYPPVQDFYEDWARGQFGAEVGPAAAKIFCSVDGYMPRPADWNFGPGALRIDMRSWDEMKRGYDFVEKFSALQPKVLGRGNRARFDYWDHSFAYLKAMGELSCTFGEYARAIGDLGGIPVPAEQKKAAHRTLLPLRIKTVRLLETIYEHLFATIGTTGELGTVMNWEQHLLPDLFIKPGQALENILGEPLPPEAQLSQDYHRSPRLMVTSARGLFRVEEELNVRALVLGSEAPTEVALYWRQMGQGDFVKVPLASVARGIYSAQWNGGKDDLEYYVKAVLPKGEELYFPPTAPALNQTMIATGEGK